MYLIILAAGQGTRLRPLTDTRPKCLVELNGRPLLDWQIDAAHAAGFEQIAVIGGYRGDMIDRAGVVYVDNPQYDSTNMVSTLWCAEHLFADGFVVSYGDIVYEPRVLAALAAAKEGVHVIVDTDWEPYWEARFDDVLEDAETLMMEPERGIVDIGQEPRSRADIQAQYIGLSAFLGTGVAALRDVYRGAEAAAARGEHPFGGPRSLAKMYMTDLLQGMIAEGIRLSPVPVAGGWLEVDSFSDLKLAEQLLVTNDDGFTIRA